MNKMNVWISVDDEGNIKGATTTDPSLLDLTQGDNSPVYSVLKENLDFETLEQLYLYKVVEGDLVRK